MCSYSNLYISVIFLKLIWVNIYIHIYKASHYCSYCKNLECKQNVVNLIVLKLKFGLVLIKIVYAGVKIISFSNDCYFLNSNFILSSRTMSVDWMENWCWSVHTVNNFIEDIFVGGFVLPYAIVWPQALYNINKKHEMFLWYFCFFK